MRQTETISCKNEKASAFGLIDLGSKHIRRFGVGNLRMDEEDGSRNLLDFVLALHHVV